MQTWEWTERRRRAALLVAEGRQNDTEIAQALGIGGRTLDYWKRRPAFAARVQVHRNDLVLALRAEGIANRQNRVDALNRDFTGMETVIAERAVDPAMSHVPGGKTGLLVRQLKSIGFGENNQMVEEFAVDIGLLKARRDHLRQAAEELGQWTEKREMSGEVLLRQYVGVSVDDV